MKLVDRRSRGHTPSGFARPPVMTCAGCQRYPPIKPCRPSANDRCPLFIQPKEIRFGALLILTMNQVGWNFTDPKWALGSYQYALYIHIDLWDHSAKCEKHGMSERTCGSSLQPGAFRDCRKLSLGMTVVNISWRDGNRPISICYMHAREVARYAQAPQIRSLLTTDAQAELSGSTSRLWISRSLRFEAMPKSARARFNLIAAYAKDIFPQR